MVVVRYLLAGLLIFTLFTGIVLADEKPLLALNPTPMVVIEISHPGEVHHLALPPSLKRSQTVSLHRQDILGESLKNAINPLQTPPDYRFKPALQPYTVGEVFMIPTPVKLASF